MMEVGGIGGPGVVGPGVVTGGVNTGQYGWSTWQLHHRSGLIGAGSVHSQVG